MNSDILNVLEEIRDMVKVMKEGQEQLLRSISEIREDQKKLHEEIRISNMVLNNLPFRIEVLN